jgi:exodeoxyribonuclease VII large subunit
VRPYADDVSQASFDLDLDVDGGAQITWTVGELHDAVDAVLQRTFDGELWVRGEVSGCKEARNGHLYFELIEQRDDRRVALKVTFFKGNRDRLARMLQRTGLRITDGIKLRVSGRLQLFNSQLSLILSGIDPTHTLGELAADRSALLQRLSAEGVLRANAAHAMPLVPLRVGLVGSRSSAGVQDFGKTLRASGLGFTVVFCDAAVQGADAPAAIASGVRRLAHESVDVICLVRGGGARTDLAAFDAEVVARAIVDASVPVLCGIGHEIDRAVADEVAHTSLRTPTACAHALVERVGAYMVGVESAWRAVTVAAADAVLRASDGLAADTGRLVRDANRAVAIASERLDVAERRVRASVGTVVRRADAEVERAVVRLTHASRSTLERAEGRLDVTASLVDASDPHRLLARGWSITHTADGVLVRSPASAPPGTMLVTTTADGAVESTVTGGDS